MKKAQNIHYLGALLVLFSLFIMSSCRRDVNMAFTLESKAFSPGQRMPAKFTCDGEDVSPALSWKGAPSNTKSFAIIMDDPDAPSGTWVHWVIYDIPEDVTSFQEGVAKIDELPDGTKQGITDFRRIGYFGPCPPKGAPHHYHFKIYALDSVLNLPARLSKADIEEAMDGHILAKAEYIGIYGR